MTSGGQRYLTVLLMMFKGDPEEKGPTIIMQGKPYKAEELAADVCLLNGLQYVIDLKKQRPGEGNGDLSRTS